jgi:hypothetical protein
LEVVGSPGARVALKLTRSVVRNNNASVSGGGLDLNCGATALVNSTLTSNHAQLGGAVAFECPDAWRGDLDVSRDCNISNNSAVSICGISAATILHAFHVLAMAYCVPDCV